MEKWRLRIWGVKTNSVGCIVPAQMMQSLFNFEDKIKREVDLELTLD